jgi:hypothetical protein
MGSGAAAEELGERNALQRARGIVTRAVRGAPARVKARHLGISRVFIRQIKIYLNYDKMSLRMNETVRVDSIRQMATAEGKKRKLSKLRKALSGAYLKLKIA